MDFFNLPFTWLIGIAFGLTALFVLLRGLQLPSNYSENQRIRSLLKRKVEAIENAVDAEPESEKSS